MSLKETLKQESQKEREKLKNMSARDRVWYIWEYYKVHIFLLFVLIFIIYLIGNIFYNKTFTNQLYYVVINNTNIPGTSFEELNQEFKDYMNYGKKDTITADGSMLIKHGDIASELDYGNMAKISAIVAISDLDIMICDQVNMDHYNQLDAFQNLEQVLPDDLWQKVKNTAYYAKNSENQEIACAIDLNYTKFPQKTGVQIEPCYLGIVSNTQHIDTIIAWLQFVLDLP